jgi:hypothetical protein
MMYDEETRAAYPCVSRRERRSSAEARVVMSDRKEAEMVTRSRLGYQEVTTADIPLLTIS